MHLYGLLAFDSLVEGVIMPEIPELFEYQLVVLLIDQVRMVTPSVLDQLMLRLNLLLGFSPQFPDLTHLLVVLTVTPVIEIAP